MVLPKYFTTVTPLSKSLTLFFFLFFTLMGFFLGSYYQYNMQVRQYLRDYKAEFNEKQNQIDSSGTIQVTGIIRTSGLRPEEKQKFELTQSDFQFGGYFIESSPEILDYYLGKCIKAQGTIKPGWEDLKENNYETNGQWTYGINAFLITDFEVMPYSECLSFTDKPQAITNSNPMTLTGVLKHGTRPAPDINYDYLFHTTPVPWEDGSGTSTTSEIVAIPIDSNLLVQFEENIGKTVTLTGSKEWGYAESAFFAVQSLKVD